MGEHVDCWFFELLNETAECIKQCDKVLEKKPQHVKALYRKGQALHQRKDYNEAIDVFKKVLEIEPTNKAAEQQIVICKQEIAHLRAQEKKRFAGMFDKLAKETEKEEQAKDHPQPMETESAQTQKAQVESTA
uniref:peptidylprolyl isomerase n=1 Tax=Acrobeloides nanus TaxID=290746 RepID=A0A914DC10_9BILA